MSILLKIEIQVCVIEPYVESYNNISVIDKDFIFLIKWGDVMAFLSYLRLPLSVLFVLASFEILCYCEHVAS